MKVIVRIYTLPNGRRHNETIGLPDRLINKYQAIQDCGCRLAAEILSTGEVSQTITCDDFDYDIVITKGSDLEENKNALIEMIERFDAVRFYETVREMQNEHRQK